MKKMKKNHFYYSKKITNTIETKEILFCIHMHKVDFQNPNNKTMHTNELIPQKQQQQIQNKCSKKLLVTTQHNSRIPELNRT